MLKFKRLFATLVLPALLTLTPVAYADTIADDIADQTLRYAASYGSWDAGEIEIVIRNEAHGYSVTSTARPSAVAALFVKAHTSDTRFVRRGGVVALDRGAEKLAGQDDYRRSFRVDHAAGRIEFSGGETYAIQPGDRFEAAAFPLLLMLRPLDDIAGARVWEVSAKRVRGYVYEQPVAEVVRVPAGKFASWKISRHRSDRPDDRVTVWLNRDDNRFGAGVPLRIAVRKGGDTSTLRLTGR